MEAELADAISDLGGVVEAWQVCRGPDCSSVELLSADQCRLAFAVGAKGDATEAAAVISFVSEDRDGSPHRVGVTLCTHGFGVMNAQRADLKTVANGQVVVVAQPNSSHARYESLQSLVAEHVPWCSLEAQLAAQFCRV